MKFVAERPLADPDAAARKLVEHQAPEWQTAMEALILVATHGRPDDARAHWHHAGIELR